jgi:hypothetical protein
MIIRSNGPGRARTQPRDSHVGSFSNEDLEIGLCPGGANNVVVDDASIGDRVDCSICGEKLEVISLHPVDFDYAFEDEEWEDFEEEDGEDSDEVRDRDRDD